jgi:predicted RNA-binding Zn ribbon-like protein
VPFYGRIRNRCRPLTDDTTTLVSMDEAEIRSRDDVELVRAFVNTAELDQDTDELSTVEGTLEWLRARSLDVEAPLTESQRLRLVEVREAVRDLIAAGHGAAMLPGSRTVLDAAGRAARLTLNFDEGGTAFLRSEATGVERALGTILAAGYTAMIDGSWERLKICDNGECRWAFYDRSRNHSGKWCSMQSCGNRMKARAFRSRHETGH